MTIRIRAVRNATQGATYRRCPLDQAEHELFPGVPYHSLNKDQRVQTYQRAGEIYFARTGRLPGQPRPALAPP
jgi:hypothetical protein